jgi:hypothetical protein
MITALIIAAIVGLLVFLVGTFFDKTPDNRYAGLGGLIVFILVFLLKSGLTL